MITNSDGEIAYHAYRIEEDGLYFIQYGFDGEVIEKRRVKSY